MSETESQQDYEGFISTEHTIWCGACVQWVQRAIPTKARFAKAMRKLGWVKTRARGWVCPACKSTVSRQSRAAM